MLCDGPSPENIASTVVDCTKIESGHIGFFRVGLVPKSQVSIISLFLLLYSGFRCVKSVTLFIKSHVPFNKLMLSHLLQGSLEAAHVVLIHFVLTLRSPSNGP